MTGSSLVTGLLMPIAIGLMVILIISTLAVTIMFWSEQQEEDREVKEVRGAKKSRKFI